MSPSGPKVLYEKGEAFGIPLDLCVSIVIRISSLVFLHSEVREGSYPSSIKEMGRSEWFFIIHI